MNIFAELKRRNVYRAATVYAVGSWLLLQIADVLFPAFDMPVSSMRILAVVLLLMFPVALTLSWVYDLTTDGIQRSAATGPTSTSKQLNWKFAAVLLIFGVVVVVILLAIPKTRVWLVETGVGLVMKTAALISPVELEKQLGIAVLPFVNMSSDPENEYFSDGISEEILNSLVRTSPLPVIARTSSFQFKGQNQDIKKIGRLLGVTHILEGSVRKANNRVRITAQLIDSMSGAHLWSEVYERELSDIFALQADIADIIVRQIAASLPLQEKELFLSELTKYQVESHGTENIEAYELWLRGLQLLRMDDPFAVEKSLVYFEQAIALDNDYADAWLMKGMTFINLSSVQMGLLIPSQAQAQAIAALRKTLELVPDHATAMGFLGSVLMSQEYRWQEGMALMERSVALNPNEPLVLSIYGHFLHLFRRDNAFELLDRAYRLDPLSVTGVSIKATALFGEGRALDALALVENELAKSQDGYGANYLAAYFNLAVGRVDAAEAFIKRAQRVVGADYPSLKLLESWKTSLRGDRPLARQQAEQIRKLAQTKRVANLAYMGWGSREENARNWDIAIQQRHPEIFAFLFGPRLEYLDEADWQRIQRITRTADVASGSTTDLVARSQSERERLLARATQLSPQRLELFEGYYDRGAGTTEIIRSGNRLEARNLEGDLLAVLIAVGPNRFEHLDWKVEVEFLLQEGDVMSYVAKSGQEEIRAKRIENPRPE